MAEQKCSQCKKVRRCKMVVEYVAGKRVISYVCVPCLKELEAPDTTTTVDEGGA